MQYDAGCDRRPHMLPSLLESCYVLHERWNRCRIHTKWSLEVMELLYILSVRAKLCSIGSRLCSAS